MKTTGDKTTETIAYVYETDANAANFSLPFIA